MRLAVEAEVGLDGDERGIPSSTIESIPDRPSVPRSAAPIELASVTRFRLLDDPFYEPHRALRNPRHSTERDEFARDQRRRSREWERETSLSH